MHRQWLLLAVVPMGLAACSGRPSPADAFRSWLGQVEQCHLDGMKAALSQESLRQVEALSNALRGMVPKDRQGTFHILTELCRGYQKGSMEVLDEHVDGDQATLRVKTRDKTVEARLVREEGTWKLDFASLMRQAISSSFGLKPPEKAPSTSPGAPVEPPPAAAPSATGAREAQDPAR